MFRHFAIVVFCFTTSGCVPFIVHNALERNADNKERYETHRHREKMRELDIQEKALKQQAPQYPTYETDGGIVRDNPF